MTLPDIVFENMWIAWPVCLIFFFAVILVFKEPLRIIFINMVNKSQNVTLEDADELFDSLKSELESLCEVLQTHGSVSSGFAQQIVDKIDNIKLLISNQLNGNKKDVEHITSALDLIYKEIESVKCDVKEFLQDHKASSTELTLIRDRMGQILGKLDKFNDKLIEIHSAIRHLTHKEVGF